MNAGDEGAVAQTIDPTGEVNQFKAMCGNSNAKPYRSLRRIRKKTTYPQKSRPRLGTQLWD